MEEDDVNTGESSNAYTTENNELKEDNSDKSTTNCKYNINFYYILFL